MPLVVSSLILSALHCKWLNWVCVCSRNTCLLCAKWWNTRAQTVPRRQVQSQAQIIDEICVKSWARRDPMAANTGSSSSAVLEILQVWVQRLHWCARTEGNRTGNERGAKSHGGQWSRLREDKRMKPQRWWPVHSCCSSFTTDFETKPILKKIWL